MEEEQKTRVEKLIPDYGKLNFTNKEEKSREDELSRFSENDKLIWRQLESQAHMANEQLEKALDNFQGWLTEYEEVKDMVVVQRALNVMGTFGRLLLALDTERQFLLSNKEIEIREVEVEKSSSGELNDENRKRLALCLYGEMGFDSGGKGRGNFGTSQKVGEILGRNKKTIEAWINQMINDGKIGKMIENFQGILKEIGKPLKNTEEKPKETDKINKEPIESIENEIPPAKNGLTTL